MPVAIGRRHPRVSGGRAAGIRAFPVAMVVGIRAFPVAARPASARFRWP
jgi:hypothetical protein